MAGHGANTATSLDPDRPVALYLKLTADRKDSDRLESHTTAFCSAHPNAEITFATRSRHPFDPEVVAYLTIHGGPLRGAVRGEAEARQALTTLVAATTELFMFDPVLVPRPHDLPDASEDHPYLPKPTP